MHQPRSPKYSIAAIAAAFVVAGAAAQAQVGPSGNGANWAPGHSAPVETESRWGQGLTLSENSPTNSGTPGRDDTFFVLRDAEGGSVLGLSAGVEHRMSLGFRGIWSPGPNRELNEPSLAANAEDDEKIFYYTMQIEGANLRLSYFPGSQREFDPAADPETSVNQNGIAVGANYDRRFDRFGVGVSAGYASPDAFNDNAIPEMVGWTVGARLDVGGLQLSGGVQLGDDSRNDPGSSTPTGWDESWNLGARYRWGRNDLSLAYAYGENRASLAAPGDDKLDSATLSFVRKLDIGVEWSINLLWADRDARFGRDPADPDGTALSTAIRLSF